MSKEKQYEIKNKEEKNRTLNLEVVIKESLLEEIKPKAIKRVGRDLELKGFRKGSAPDKMVIEHVGKMKILEESVYDALNIVLPQIVKEEKIDAISQPQINITKIAPGSPVEFKASFILMPEIELADYKKIASSVEKTGKVEVTEKEIQDYIDYLVKSRVEAENLKNKTSGGESAKENVENKTETDSKEETPLPEFNDEFVKTLGNFQNVDDFKKQLNENMQKDKESKEVQKRRIAIMEKIIDDSKVDLPDVLVDEELFRMMGQFRTDITRMGISPEDYLKEIKKTEDDLKKEWRPDAIKRAKMNLILPKIAMKEDIKPDQEVVEKEIKHLMEHYKDLTEESARVYITNVLQNEKVFEYLENL